MHDDDHTQDEGMIIAWTELDLVAPLVQGGGIA